MRTLIRCIPLTLMLAFSAQAQIPRTISYQGILTDTSGNPRPNGAYTMTFRLYLSSSGGSAIWSESRSLQLKGGLFSTSLGDATPFPGTLLFNTQYWLSVQVGAGTEVAPRMAMDATPYSLSSEKADSARIAGGVGPNAVTTSGIADNAVTTAKIQNGTIQFQDVAQNGAATGQVMKWNGSEWVAANDSLGISTGGPFLPLAGGTMTGPITNTGDPPITMGKGNFGSGNINSGTHAFVAGSNNRARGSYSVISGGGGATPADSNAALGIWSTIGGGFRNIAFARTTTVGGGERNIAGDVAATVNGGYFNAASGADATIGGGNNNIASTIGSTVGGGWFNTASGRLATVGGGDFNKARGQYSFVGGGGGATAADGNSALGDYSAICGGYQNRVGGATSVIGGGQGNNASGGVAIIGGGAGNIAASNYSTIGGGWFNTTSVSGDYATVGGGRDNTASSSSATVGGGMGNTASGYAATVGGGYFNAAAGAFSFAAGTRAKANHDGAFVWADQTSADFLSTEINEFNIRASGGTRIFSDGALTAGVTLAAGAGAWASVSDSTLKRNARLVVGEEILQKLARLPIKQWSYKSQDPSVEHIGPMAQDFYGLFRLGDDEKTISTIDPAGIALAAIQELYKQNQELRAQVAKLETVVQSLTNETH